MKTVTKIALAGLATVVLTAGNVIANDAEWVAIDNHHGSVTYVRQWQPWPAPARTQTTTTTTVAFTGHRHDTRTYRHETVRRQEGEFRSVKTPQGGDVNYYAPTD